MSHVTRDPRCPNHPAYAAYITWGARIPQGWLRWTCAACNRPLGAAAVTDDGNAEIWPQGRRETPRDMAWNARDNDWLLAQEEKAE